MADVLFIVPTSPGNRQTELADRYWDKRLLNVAFELDRFGTAEE